jgi:hypothetical protein
MRRYLPSRGPDTRALAPTERYSGLDPLPSSTTLGVTMFELITADDNGTPFALIGLIVWIILGLAQFVLFIAALVSILGSKRYTGGGKFLWVVVVFFAPFLGPIGWFVGGRTAQIRTNVP